MELVKTYLEVYQDLTKRKRFFQEHFPQGKKGSNFVFADTEEKNDNLRQFLQNLIIHSGLLTCEQDFILLPKKLPKWYPSFGLFKYIVNKFGPKHNYNLLNYCWSEKMKEPLDTTSVHWHLFDFYTAKYSRDKKFLSQLKEYVRHIYINPHWRISLDNQISLVGGYDIKSIFIIAEKKGGFYYLTRELDLESIYRRVCKGNVSEFLRLFFPEIDHKQYLKRSDSTAERLFHYPLFTTKMTKGYLEKSLLGIRYSLGKKTISEISPRHDIGIALITNKFGGIYTPQGLCRIFPLDQNSAGNQFISVRNDSLIIPDRIFAQNILGAGKIALERGDDLTKLSLPKLISWVTGTYYRDILRHNPPELIFNKPANLRELSKNEWEKMMVELVLSAQNGDEFAKSIICEEYQKIVHNIAQRYFCPGEKPEDLLQYGFMGLLIAINDFDPSKNSSFTPFAIMNIERKILKIKQSATRQKRKSQIKALSLDDSIRDSNETFIDLLESDRNDDPLEIIINDESNKSIEVLMSNLSEILSPQEMQVLTQLIIADTKRKPLTEIADRLKLSPDAVKKTRIRIRDKFGKKVFPQFPHLATLIRS